MPILYAIFETRARDPILDTMNENARKRDSGTVHLKFGNTTSFWSRSPMKKAATQPITPSSIGDCANAVGFLFYFDILNWNTTK